MKQSECIVGMPYLLGLTTGDVFIGMYIGGCFLIPDKDFFTTYKMLTTTTVRSTIYCPSGNDPTSCVESITTVVGFDYKD